MGTRTSQLTCTIQTRVVQGSDGRWELAHAEDGLKLYADFPRRGAVPLKTTTRLCAFQGSSVF